MLEIHDELMTPGCPQCAVKHLSAALYHRASTGAANEAPPSQAHVCLCIAAINLVEVLNGYKSHLWYAVGALERAEECALMTFGELRTAREARLMLEELGLKGVKDALYHIGIGAIASHAEWAAAHFDEARRELPAYADTMTMNNIIETIEAIRSDFFITDQEVAVATSTEGAGEGGEEAMATKKAVKAEVDPKAAKAACKGGKAKKACGKCKK